jgi:hypothetical protein
MPAHGGGVIDFSSLSGIAESLWRIVKGAFWLAVAFGVLVQFVEHLERNQNGP